MELVEEMGTDLRSIVVFLVAIFDISMTEWVQTYFLELLQS